MPVIKTQDRADEFRISIQGRLAGESVRDVERIWSAALAENLPRNIRVDISLLTGYDAAGGKLLRDLSQHGTDFSAGTPGSLVFLAEITAPRRKAMAIAPERLAEPSKRPHESAPRPLQMRAAATS